MVKKTFISILALIIIISTAVFTSEVVDDNAKIEDITQPEFYISEEAGYQIKFPSDWEVMKGVMGTDVVALAPIKDPEDLFRENANIIYAKLDLPLNREEYYAYNLKSLSQLLVDFDLENSEDIKIDGMEAKKIIFTHTMGVVNAKVLQYLILDGDKAYVMTFTADPLDFDKYRESFENIGNSFKFK